MDVNDEWLREQLEADAVLRVAGFPEGIHSCAALGFILREWVMAQEQRAMEMHDGTTECKFGDDGDGEEDGGNGNRGVTRTGLTLAIVASMEGEGILKPTALDNHERACVAIFRGIVVVPKGEADPRALAAQLEAAGCGDSLGTAVPLCLEHPNPLRSSDAKQVLDNARAHTTVTLAKAMTSMSITSSNAVLWPEVGLHPHILRRVCDSIVPADLQRFMFEHGIIGPAGATLKGCVHMPRFLVQGARAAYAQLGTMFALSGP